MKKVRVLLADDHKVVRDGLRLLINGQRDLRVVGEAADGKEALEKACALKPDVVVMDLSMPRLNGLQATERLRAEQPAVKVVALTLHEDATYLLQLCKAGAAGYVLKRSAGDDLIQAIRAVAGGALYFDPAVANQALRVQAGEPATKAGQPAAELSEREKQVLTLLAWGYSNKEIAGDLNLSIKTVETYRLRVAEKLGLRSRTEIVKYALRQGWLNESVPLVRPSR
jgi:two-component system, NarL family, response regulator NreC